MPGPSSTCLSLQQGVVQGSTVHAQNAITHRGLREDCKGSFQVSRHQRCLCNQQCWLRPRRPNNTTDIRWRNRQASTRRIRMPWLRRQSLHALTDSQQESTTMPTLRCRTILLEVRQLYEELRQAEGRAPTDTGTMPVVQALATT